MTKPFVWFGGFLNKDCHSIGLDMFRLLLAPKHIFLERPHFFTNSVRLIAATLIFQMLTFE